MINLREYKTKATELEDYIPWCVMVDDGIVLNRDGNGVVGFSPAANQLKLYIGNDGLPIPAENRQSLFVPFFTTKRSGSGIGLSLSRRMMIQQGGMLDLAEKQVPGCHAGFILTIQTKSS